MAEHTPTPWIAEGTSVYYLDWDGVSYEGRGKDYQERLTNRFWLSVQGQERRIPREELEANAAFIVRAVNSHDALVRALEEALLELGAYEEEATGESYNNVNINKLLAEAGVSIPSNEGGVQP